MQSLEVLKILNDFRNKMDSLDISISDAEIKSLYDLYNKSDLTLDEIRRKVYDRFKKYKEIYKIGKDIETISSNHDLLDINFKKKGITLNYQDVDILNIIACNTYEELINYALNIPILNIDEEYIRSYVTLDDAKKFVFESYQEALVSKYIAIRDSSVKTKAKLDLMIEKGIITEDECKELAIIISGNGSMADIVERAYQAFGKKKCDEIIKVFSSGIVSKSGVKDSSWNTYLSMYEKIKEFDTFTLDGIMKYSSVVMINDEPNYDRLKNALDLAKKLNKRVRLNTLIFYMDFPAKLKNESKKSIKFHLNKYVLDLIQFIKKNGYEEQIDSIDAFNELINRFPSNKSIPYALRGTFRDSSDNLDGGWLNYLDINDLFDIIAKAKKELPNVEFLYNEVNLQDSRKFEIFKMILTQIKQYEKEFNTKLIDAIGEQMHIDSSVDISKIDELFSKLKDLGYKTYITEFDMFVNILGDKYITPMQLEEYRQSIINKLYDVLVKYEDSIEGFTIWSKTDDMDHNLSRINETRIKRKEKLIPNAHGGYFDQEFNSKRDSIVSNFSVINGPALQLFNYHTHTNRCGHSAPNKDSDYVEEALKKNMKAIGFTEHVPSTKFDYDGVDERMSLSDLDEYIKSIKLLDRDYDGIKVYSGFEAEYSEALRLHLVNLRKKVDYMILGQHEVTLNGLVVDPFNNPDYPLQYAKSVIEALDSGIFDILAHPDYFMRYRDTMQDYDNYRLFMKNAREAADLIGRKCEELKIPLEINLGGIERRLPAPYKDGEHEYTHPVFYNELLKYDVRFIYGADAHNPKSIRDFNENILRANTILKTSEMVFVRDDYNPVEFRNPILDQKLMLTEANSYSYETMRVISMLEKILEDETVVDLDIKIMDKIEGFIYRIQEDNKKQSKERFEALLKVADDHFISDQNRERKLNSNIKYMDSQGAVTTARINLLYQLKSLVSEASYLGCVTKEDYLIVLKELLERERTNSEDIKQRSIENIENYRKNKLKKR